MRYLLSLILLVGCGSSPVDYQVEYVDHDPRSNEVDEELLEYVEQFGAEFECIDVSDVPPRFEALELPRIGVCKTWTTTSRSYHEILIDPDTWDDMSDTRRELLMYHELGHCLLEMDHSDDRDSIMYPSIMNEERAKAYKADRSKYLEEFHQVAGC